jgi:hypothetical protein
MPVNGTLEHAKPRFLAALCLPYFSDRATGGEESGRTVPNRFQPNRDANLQFTAGCCKRYTLSALNFSTGRSTLDPSVENTTLEPCFSIEAAASSCFRLVINSLLTP